LSRGKSMWQVWKHALGAFDEEDGYDPASENKIAYIRTFIVVSNLLCAYVFMFKMVGFF
jgi:hypothetical protein